MAIQIDSGSSIQQRRAFDWDQLAVDDGQILTATRQGASAIRAQRQVIALPNLVELRASESPRVRSDCFGISLSGVFPVQSPSTAV